MTPANNNNQNRELLPFEYQKVASMAMAQICNIFNIMADDYLNRGFITDTQKFKMELPFNELDVPVFNALAKVIGHLTLAKANERKYTKAEADEDLLALNKVVVQMSKDCEDFERKSNEIGLVI